MCANHSLMTYRILAFLALSVFSISTLRSQTTINFDEDNSNKLYIKLYGHIDYNQKLESGRHHNGKMDVHRLVTLFGYQFSRKTQFVSEIEVEHVKEIFVEQAFIKHRLAKSISLKAGLMIIPMGMVNEMHEPTFFYSVERPLLDKLIIPSTWREVGIGITGLLPEKSLKYQLYLVNNPLGYDGSAKVSGASGIRKARQKGAEAVVSSFPGLCGQLEYFGVDRLKLGISGYYGKTSTTLANTLDQSLENYTATVDSSTVNMTMVTMHGMYNPGNLTIRGQYTLSSFQNTAAYNQFAASDVPDLMHGYYLLAAYDFHKSEDITVAPFVRFSQLDNHLKVNEELEENASLKQNILTIGANYKPHPGVVFKCDYQFVQNQGANNFNNLNLGVGVWF